MDDQQQIRRPSGGPFAHALEVIGLSKTFGGIVALDHVDFAASSGEVHALLGENGAGKSTLIKVLTGALRADAGEILLDGTPLALHNPRQARAAGIGAVFQELSLIPDLSVAQNIWFRREDRTPWHTISTPALRRRTHELFEELELPPVDPNRVVRSLSVAERQLIEIAKTISQRPRILILDEATSALSPREVAWLLGLCRRLAASGSTVIYISHRLGEVREVATACTVFRNGKHVGTHSMHALDDDQIVGLMLGRVRDRLYPERQRTATERTLLTVRHLRYGARLSDVSFDLHEGEILGIGGLQGQGQAELMLSLYGIHHAQGTIEINGRRVRINNPRDALAAGIGLALVPEDRKNQGLLLPKPIRENIVLPILSQIAHLGFLDRSVERKLTRSAMQQLNVVAHGMEQPVGNLSGGNQQKVVIAKLLQTRAHILLLYDLTRGVDVGTKADIFQLMRDLVARGFAILFYSTDMQELIHVADRIVVLSDGTITATLVGDAMTEEQILRASIVPVARTKAAV
jgi:ribose transport system ATP-binding protein